METNFKEKIEAFIKEKTSFIITLDRPTQFNFSATVDSSRPKDEIEFLSGQDEIDFTEMKNDTKVCYTRNYSDFPPSNTSFLLSEVKNVEEVRVK